MMLVSRGMRRLEFKRIKKSELEYRYLDMCDFRGTAGILRIKESAKSISYKRSIGLNSLSLML